DGNVVPVTVISAGPCTIIRKGENSVQVGYREIRPEAVKRLLNKPMRMSFEKAGVKPFRFVRCLPADELESIEALTDINVSMFKEGDSVSITGTSKGKGFSGAMERHNFNGQKTTHGQSDRARATGSMGSGTNMARTIKGKKLPGQLGNVRRTIKGLKVVKVDEQKNLILVRGSIPGAANGLVIIRQQA
ncbi:MAG: 50S ribosomal protein L3, partial [Candidatus Riflebacteria bacterium]|nr:50S ribosomal protein L3 [Candidatus Riflebacteria bacterium]